MIEQLFQNSPIFKNVDKSYVARLFNDHACKTYKTDEIIIRQGDVGEGMFFIVEGEVGIILSSPADKISEYLIKTLQPGEFFGEICMFTNQKRMASAKAKSDLKLIYLEGNEFRKHVEAGDKNAIKMYLNFVPILINHLEKTNSLLLEASNKLPEAHNPSEILRFKNKLMKELLI